MQTVVSSLHEEAVFCEQSDEKITLRFGFPLGLLSGAVFAEGSEEEGMRVRELTEEERGQEEGGKAVPVHSTTRRVVLQLWWGGSGRYNWSKYSLAHISMDPEIRREFFADVTDPLLEAVGPENVYGAHLLEETGMQFGVDVDVAGIPEDLSDGDNNGSNWDQPTWLGVGGIVGYLGGPYVPNIRRYNQQFKADTGLDMREAPLWSYTKGWPIYREWDGPDCGHEPCSRSR